MTWPNWTILAQRHGAPNGQGRRASANTGAASGRIASAHGRTEGLMIGTNTVVPNVGWLRPRYSLIRNLSKDI